jgi:hypothetical protein
MDANKVPDKWTGEDIQSSKIFEDVIKLLETYGHFYDKISTEIISLEIIKGREELGLKYSAGIYFDWEELKSKIKEKWGEDLKNENRN